MLKKIHHVHAYTPCSCCSHVLAFLFYSSVNLAHDIDFKNAARNIPITESMILGEGWRDKHTDRNNYEMHQLQINFNFSRKL